MKPHFLALAAASFALAGCMSVGGLIGNKPAAPDTAKMQCETDAGGKLIEINGPAGKMKTCKMPDGRLLRLDELTTS